MRGRWQDLGHLIRPAVALLIGMALFAALRSAVVPPSFGRYGHYRAGALADAAKRPIRFAGQQLCAGCHPGEAEVRDKGKHRGVSCEACHGALAAHAADPGVKPKLPDTARLCRGCHETDVAKPAWFKQVTSAEHSGGEDCKSCHKPHSPGM